MDRTRQGHLPSVKPDRRLHWLDALRGWAILAVVLVHTGQSLHVQPGFLFAVTSAGQYGVQLFFIVSAITISMTYKAQIERYGAHWRTSMAWLIKRFFRIAPLYYFAIAFYAIEQYAIFLASHHRYGSLPAGWYDILANILFIHAWISSANNNVVPGGWSIGVEMSFYILVPLIWCIKSERWRSVVLVAAILPALLLSIFVNFGITGTTYVENDSFLYYWFPTQFPVLAVGMFFFFKKIKAEHRASAKGAEWLFLAAFFAIFFAGLFFGTLKAKAPILSPVLTGLAFLCLVLSLKGKVGLVLVNPFLEFLGRVSFSIYIFHFVVLDAYRAVVFRGSGMNAHASYLIVIVFPLVVLVSGCIAWCSKRLLENPGIALGHRLANYVMKERALTISA